MNYLLAETDSQVGLGLRLLFSEKIKSSVETVFKNNEKIVFHITPDCDNATFNILKQKFEELKINEEDDEDE